MKRSHQIILQFIILFLIIFLGGRYFGRNSPSDLFKVTDISKRIRFTEQKDFSGAVAVNLDDDSEREIYVGGYGTSNLLLKRQGSELKPLFIKELEDPEGLTFAVAACDVDQDGRDEIFLLNRGEKSGTSVPKLLKYTKGKWNDTISSDKDLLLALSAGSSVTCIDRKGDGHYGLAVVSSGGPLLYLEESNGKLYDISKKIGFTGTSDGRSILGVPGPRGFTNIFVGTAKENFFFENDGTGFFIEKAKDYSLVDAQFETRGATTFDFNHDDVPDLVYGNHYGPLRLMRQNRDGTFTDVTPENMTSSYAVNAAASADLNLDGEEDLYLNNINTANITFARNKNEWFALDIPLLEEAEMSGISTLIGDLDGSAGFEILNTHGMGRTFPLKMYSIKPQGKWIGLSVHFKNGGLPRGATVRFRTNQRDYVRTISTGSGRFADYTDEMFMGVGEKEKVLSVEITLPSGKKTEFQGPFRMETINTLTL